MGKRIITGIFLVTISIFLALFIAFKFISSTPSLLPVPDDLVAKEIQNHMHSAYMNIFLWVSINLIIHILSISSGVLATVLVALTTKENASDIKIYTVTITALTTALIAAQSVFHVQQNTNAYINSLNDLQNLEAKYAFALQSHDNSGSLQRDTIIEIAKIQRDRFRSLADIGDQDNTSRSELLSPDMHGGSKSVIP